ncbi:MaoC/PaaZ C-terminal domain-containing protein [Hoeflea sp.]|uniref:MaoC/PaaZ C-terminal domain-containing protein n=1 Tax=Hoeflea sp. TaxID=1940281 RepID=UPI003A8E1913
MLVYQVLIAFKAPETRAFHSARDIILYALAVGAGADLPSPIALPFVYENGLKPLPSFYNVLSWPSNAWLHELGIDMSRLVHGAERVEIFKPVPAEGGIVTRPRIARVLDRGTGKGLILEVVVDVHSSNDDLLLARSVSSLFAMGDGGLEGAPPAERSQLPPLPDRPPEGSIDVPTRNDQAALYRLCGDMNPIHIDPDAARLLGLQTPLLHGLCTLGICVHAMARLFPAIADGMTSGFETRFRAPVFPGETLTIDYWTDDDGIRFETRVGDRLVLTGGSIGFAARVGKGGH